MNYYVRRQAITGKLILQHDTTPGVWVDAKTMPHEYLKLVDANEWRDLKARVAKAEKRAAAQKLARAKT